MNKYVNYYIASYHVQIPNLCISHILFFVRNYIDVLLGDHLGNQVAVKVLKDKSMVQQFLTEAYVMTYVTVFMLSPM